MNDYDSAPRGYKKQGKAQREKSACLNGPSKRQPDKKKQHSEHSEWQALFDATLDIIALISSDFRILKLNKAGYGVLGKTAKDVIGKKCFQVVHGLDSPIAGCPCENALRTKTSGQGEIHDHGMCLLATASPILDEDNRVTAFAHTIKDITELKMKEKELQEARNVLEQKVKERTEDLDRKNLALQEIIAQIEMDKRKVKEDIRTNVETVVFPILKQLKKDNKTAEFADILHHHLENITSSYGIKISEECFKLTPREIEICSMVKAALTNKEISRILNLSLQTVEWHRKRIRRKLGIANKGINLSSYLQGL